MAKPTHDERAEVIKTVVDTLKKATESGAKSSPVFMNVAAYVLLMDDDLAYYTEDLVAAKDDGRRLFIAKNEATLLYEASKDMPHLLGKEFRDAVATLGASPYLTAKLDAVSSDLNSFWQKNQDFLGDVRNAIAAHREKKALAYLAALERLKPLDIAQRAAEFSDPLRRLSAVLIELYGLMTPGTIIADILRGHDARGGALGSS